MIETMEANNETIKLIPFDLEGEAMLDIRFWRATKKGPRPTKRGIVIRQKTIARLIYGLQLVRAQLSADEAKEEAGIR